MNEVESDPLPIRVLEKVRYGIGLAVVIGVYYQGIEANRTWLINAFISLIIILLLDFLQISYHHKSTSNLIQRRFLYLLERSNNSFGNIPQTLKTYLGHSSSFKEIYEEFNAVMIPLFFVFLLYFIVIILPIVFLQMIWAVFLFLFYGAHWIATMITTRFTDPSIELTAAGTAPVALYCFTLYGVLGLAMWLIYPA